MSFPISRMGQRLKSTLFLLGTLVSGILFCRAGMPSVIRTPVFALSDSIKDKANPSKEKIYIDNVDQWTYDKDKNADAQILLGNVQLRHKEAHMYCDSAYLYEATNCFEAFGNVRIDQGDSVHIYCDYLHYDGRTLLSKLRENVRMEHRETTLFTDSLDYNRLNGIGYYFDTGVIADSLNTLKSLYGEYSTVTRKAVFRTNVELENPNFTLYSDTLHYDTETKLATILGPTRIVSDSGYILTNRGTYDTERDRSYLMDRSRLYSRQHFMTGDSIYYDRPGQRAEMYGSVILRDTLQKAELRGNYAEYHEDSGYGFATDSAYITEYSSADTLYAHAHRMEMVHLDSLTTLYKGMGNVRVYREDIQAVCDSIVFHSSDSTMHCMGHPFIWSPPSQITGDTIVLFMKGAQGHHAHVYENAFTSQHVSGDYYHQMRGSEIFAYFSNNEIDSVRTVGNAETIYYDLNKDSIVTSQVRTQSSAILMVFDQKELVQVKLLDKTIGKMTPAELLPSSDLYYPDFIWFPEGRPTSRSDIFRRTPAAGKAKGDRPSPPSSSEEDQPLSPPLPLGVSAADSLRHLTSTSTYPPPSAEHKSNKLISKKIGNTTGEALQVRDWEEPISNLSGPNIFFLPILSRLGRFPITTTPPPFI